MWNEAKRLRNTCTRRLRQARADYISENLNTNSGNPKKFLRNIQGLIPNSKSMSADIHLINDITQEEIPGYLTALYINDFFINIGPKLAQSCNKTWHYAGTISENSLENIATDIEEVTMLCKNININKSSCIDFLSSEILRDAFLAGPEKIVNLFNISFTSSEIPDSWKIGKVTPLQKPGDKNRVNNLRPISLLPLI